MQLTHIALHVPDSLTCAAWYKDYCGMVEVQQHGEPSKPVLWLACPEQKDEFVLVLISGSPEGVSLSGNFSHLGFALPSKAAVDELAARAQREGCLLWEPRQEPWPVGYYCGVVDPAGNQVEFSYGQPLGEG